MKYLLNSPVLTAYGTWRYEGPMGLTKARQFAASGPLRSGIGHAATARVLETTLGVPVPFRRTAVRLRPGDQALVLRLTGRLPEGRILGERALLRRGFEFGLLTRIE